MSYISHNVLVGVIDKERDGGGGVDGEFKLWVSEGRGLIGCWLLKMAGGCRESAFLSVSGTFRDLHHCAARPASDGA